MVILGEKYKINIEDMGHNGEGIGRVDGFTVFIDGGIPGDYVLAEISTLKKNYAVGEIKEILDESEDRIDPLCSVASICGGCQIMHMDYAAQLKIKEKRVRENLQRIGKINTIVHPTIGMHNPYEYRNKAQFPVGVIDGKAIMGFYKRGSHDIVQTDNCNIQSPINTEVIESVRKYIDDNRISVYNEKTRKGLIRHVVTKIGFTTGEVMVVVITNGKKLPNQDELIELLKSKITGLKSVIHNVNDKNTNVIFGNETKTIYGVDKIVDYIGDLKFNISAHSFYQVNPIQTEVLYGKAMEYANLSGTENVFDIYCGIGTISLFVAKKAKRVWGVEVIKSAIEDAKENAKANNVKNADFYVGKAEVVIPKLYKEGKAADVVIVDPPRKGCEQSVLETIVSMNPKRVVYVSCNPATLARDLAYLEENGFTTKEVQPVDMFPHTAHVECVIRLQKVK